MTATLPKLSLLFDMTSPDWASPATALYPAAVELAARADAMGFTQVILHEHHNTDDGYLPSPIVLGSAMAARTSQVRIVLSAVTAPLRHPIHIAEELAILDLVSQGRLSVVFGAGSRAAEFELFEVAMRDRPKLIEETVETLRRAWTGKPFEFRGTQARVLPRPWQSGGPPLWLGGMSEGSARRAARLGVGYQPVVPQLYDVYLAELEKLGKASPITDEFAVAPISGSRTGPWPSFLHISEDPEAAWAQIAPHALHHANTFAIWSKEEGSSWGIPLVDDAEELRQRGDYLVVAPDECVKMLTEVGPDGGVGFRPLLAGLDPSMAEASFDLLEHAVLPRLGAP